jgi:hypothetical protein
MKTKTELYANERQIILEKIFEILNIIPGDDSESNTFFLKDLDNDEKKQQQILELESDIRKHFVCGSWASFACPNVKRKVLSMIKNIMKAMKYKMISKRKLIKNSDKKLQETFYYFFK